MCFLERPLVFFRRGGGNSKKLFKKKFISKIYQKKVYIKNIKKIFKKLKYLNLKIKS